MTSNLSAVRAALIEIARDRSRPMGLRGHAEIMIAQIDCRDRWPSMERLPISYALFQREAANDPMVPELGPAEIAAALHLGDLQ